MIQESKFFLQVPHSPYKLYQLMCFSMSLHAFHIIFFYLAIFSHSFPNFKIQFLQVGWLFSCRSWLANCFFSSMVIYDSHFLFIASAERHIKGTILKCLFLGVFSPQTVSCIKILRLSSGNASLFHPTSCLHPI